MINIWMVAAGAVALAATALVARLVRRRSGDGLRTTSDGVSEEWLSNARGQRDESW